MSPGQITQWLAYQLVRGPLGPQRMDVLMASLMATIAASVGAQIPVEQFMPVWRPVAEMTPLEAGELYDAALAAYSAAHPDEVVA
jgi:hypothetical protein